MLGIAIISGSPDVRAALNVSDEQFQQIRDAPMRGLKEMQNNPENLEMVKERESILERSGVRPPSLGGYVLHPKDFDDDTWKRIQDIQKKQLSLQMIVISESYNGILTPEQQKRMNEALIANMGLLPIVSPNMFEALNLTEAQKQRMKTLQKELEPDFEKHLESIANAQKKLEDWRSAEINKQEGTQEEKMRAADKKLAGDPEYKKILDEIQTMNKTFAARFKTAMFDVLTDVQWERLQELVDNPPDIAKILEEKLREGNAKSEASGGWQPGPDSWKPGDPIPEQYRKERNQRGNFPRAK
ncbi:MAG: hypothetical protein LBI05_07460 [Planctomycetaceae bacterium]|nr:hypothetical protein [Planctomycetaceae bacterium]